MKQEAAKAQRIIHGIEQENDLGPH